MDEIRTDNKVIIETKDGSKIQGIVRRVEYDRVYVQVDDNCINPANELKELESLKVSAYTHFGLKLMKSCIISCIDSLNQVVIENSPSIAVEQKRNFVRVECGFDFEIKINDNTYKAKSKNISAGGISFSTNEVNLAVDQMIILNIPNDAMGVDVNCNAKIIKKDEFYVAQFIDIDDKIQSKIMKYVFKHVSKNSTGNHIG